MINVGLIGLTFVFYLISVFLYASHLLLRSHLGARWSTPALTAGAVIHGVGIGVRWIETSRVPVINLFEGLSFYALSVVLIYLILEARSGYKSLGAFTTLLAFVALGVAALVPGMRSTGPVPQSHWIAVHVTTSFIAYALFSLAFVAALVYLIQEHQLRMKRPNPLAYRLPPLAAAEDLGRTFSALGLPFMTLSLITGSMWAERVWGTPWIPDIQLNLALMTWLIYGAYFYARNVADWRGRRAAWLLVLGFGTVLVTFLSSHLFFSTAHRFLALG